MVDARGFSGVRCRVSEVFNASLSGEEYLYVWGPELFWAGSGDAGAPVVVVQTRHRGPVLVFCNQNSSADDARFSHQEHVQCP